MLVFRLGAVAHAMFYYEFDFANPREAELISKSISELFFLFCLLKRELKTFPLFTCRLLVLTFE